MPIACGQLIRLLGKRGQHHLHWLSVAGVSLCSITAIAVLLSSEGRTLMLVSIGESYSLTLFADRVGIVFGVLANALWIPATLYATGYLKNDAHQTRFFVFFITSLGVSNGLALSGTLLTFFAFYELLTFLTYPLITHEGTAEALDAGRKYLVHAFIGTGLIFISIAFLTWLTGDTAFHFGSAEAMAEKNTSWLYAAYLLGFLGFGVKAAVLPLGTWLPAAYVAPAPVSAMMHAVSVVKAGVLGILRLSYFVMSPAMLKNSWVQWLCLALACATILYGSTMALRTRHLKKRLNYSTVAQLSCMLIPALTFTSGGLAASLIYLVMHALIKFTLFLSAGAIILKTGQTDVARIDGIGRQMPSTMAAFTVASLGLIGLPGTAGFISKWSLFTAIFAEGINLMSILCALVQLYCIFQSMLYLIPICVRAFWSARSDAEAAIIADPEPSMLIPLMVVTFAILLFGFLPGLIPAFWNQANPSI